MNLLDPLKFIFSLFSVVQNVFLFSSHQFWYWFAYNSQIVRVELQSAAAFLYSRLVAPILLLVEGNWRFWNIIVLLVTSICLYHCTLGSTPIDIGEHGWEMLLVVKKTTQEAVSKFELLGFAAVHNLYHYPESTRLRISQVGPLTALLSIYIIYVGCPVFSPFLWSYSMAL